MWDDPLFNPGAEIEKKLLVSDPEARFVEAHREVRLLALENLYRNMVTYRNRAGYWLWCWELVIKRIRTRLKQDIPLQNLGQWFAEFEQLMMDAQTQETLGFDFGAWLDEQDQAARQQIQTDKK